jgi:GTP-binding protein
MSRKYLHERENLVCTFVLIDVRHDTQKIDLEFMEKLLQDGIPMAIIFTKADKLKDQAQVRAFEAYEQKLIERWGDTPNLFLSSAESQLGKERLLSFIETLV